MSNHNDKLRGVTTMPLDPTSSVTRQHARLKVAEMVLTETDDAGPLEPGWKPTQVQLASISVYATILGLS